MHVAGQADPAARGVARLAFNSRPCLALTMHTKTKMLLNKPMEPTE